MKKNITAWSLMGLMVLSLLWVQSVTTLADEGDPYVAVPYRSLATVQQVLRNVQGKTAVPVAIPRTLLDHQKIDSSLKEYVTSGGVERGGYRVGVDYTEDCDYYKCSNIAFFGSTSSLFDDYASVSVNLKNGDKASYYEGACGASCDPDKIVWMHGRFYYVIEGIADLKDGLAIANSMTYGTGK